MSSDPNGPGPRADELFTLSDALRDQTSSFCWDYSQGKSFKLVLKTVIHFLNLERLLILPDVTNDFLLLPSSIKRHLFYVLQNVRRLFT